MSHSPELAVVPKPKDPEPKTEAPPTPRMSGAASGTSAAAPAAEQGPSNANASYAEPPPKALLDFMVTQWAPASGKLPDPIAHHETFAARRRALSKLYPADTLVIPSGHEKVRSNDTRFRFRPSSDFYYLTGNVEPDCVLVMQPKEGGHTAILFVEPNNGRSDATFFTDRNKGELWVGARLGVSESRARYGVDEARPLADLAALLTSLNEGGRARRCMRGFSPQVDSALADHAHDKELATALSEMRLIKDAVEIDELDRVVASTKRGFEDVIRGLRRAPSERWVEGVFGLRARVEGNDVGYGTIAASGAHACILHFTHNDGGLKEGELLLLDAGVEGNSLYTADITRTLPINGAFSDAQRTIYKLVYKAQQAALAEVKPGADFLEPNRAAMRVLAHGLVDLGILADADEALHDEKQLYKRYTLHNVSHMLGLDVHDCAEARRETYKYGKLLPGMVLTVEPGLYFQENDRTVPERYRGIGVRIEDDVLVTSTGYRNLSADIPSKASDVERWMKRLWKERPPKPGKMPR